MIRYLSFYSFIGLIYYSLKFILLIDFGGKVTEFGGRKFCGIYKSHLI